MDSFSNTYLKSWRTLFRWRCDDGSRTPQRKSFTYTNNHTIA